MTMFCNEVPETLFLHAKCSVASMCVRLVLFNGHFLVLAMVGRGFMTDQHLSYNFSLFKAYYCACGSFNFSTDAGESSLTHS